MQRGGLAREQVMKASQTRRDTERRLCAPGCQATLEKATGSLLGLRGKNFKNEA
jgi:hypothetical protein